MCAKYSTYCTQTTNSIKISLKKKKKLVFQFQPVSQSLWWQLLSPQQLGKSEKFSRGFQTKPHGLTSPQMYCPTFCQVIRWSPDHFRLSELTKFSWTQHYFSVGLHFSHCGGFQAIIQVLCVCSTGSECHWVSLELLNYVLCFIWVWINSIGRVKKVLTQPTDPGPGLTHTHYNEMIVRIL